MSSRSLAAAALLAAAACRAPLQPLGPTPSTRTDVVAGAPRAPVGPPRDAAAADATAVAATGLTHVHADDVSFDLDVHAFETQPRVAHYVGIFSGSARASFAEQLERGTRYEPMIRARLRAAGLPEDLYYLALIESGFDPHATSRSSAIGLWQFMAPTAREVGLRVDWWIDERRDPVRATAAAARTMRWLRTQFGSMLLAAAAYNGGEGRVSRALVQLARADSVRADSTRLAALLEDAEAAAPAVDAGEPQAPPSGDDRFFALATTDYLRAETRNYVPQLIAALLVAKQAARYGLVVRPQPALAYDSVRVAPLVPLAAVAAAAHATRDELLDLNPHVLRGVTPPRDTMFVRVPVGAGDAASRALEDASPADRRAFRRVTTRSHESLAAIAEREAVPLRLLARYNPTLGTIRTGKWKGRLVAEQAVRVPTHAVLEYARVVPDVDAAPLGALPMPAAPNAARATAATTATGARTTGPKAKATKTSGAKASGAKASGAKSTGTKATGTKAPGAKASGAKASAAKASGAKAPAKPAAKKPAPKKPAPKKPA